MPRFDCSTLSLPLTLIAILLIATDCRAIDNWPQFRGPDGNGTANVKHAPTKWSENENIKWKQELPGRGWSSPVVADGKIWMTTAIEEFPSDEEREKHFEAKGIEKKKFKQLQIAKAIRLQLLVCDLESGKLLKQVELFKVDNPDAIHALNSYASPTPMIDGDKIYCHFGTFGTICLSRADYSEVWRRVIPLEHSVGPGSSPLVYKDLLVLICDGVNRQFVTALNKETGKTVWETERPEMDAPSGDMKKAYSTPIAVTDKSGREQLICMGSQWLVSYNPKDGSEFWRLYHGKGFSVVPRPVAEDGVVYVSTGFGNPELWAVRIDGEGDVSETHTAWTEMKNIPAKPSPLLVANRVYVVSDKGIVSCFKAEDGAEIWRNRIDGNYSASPLLADGKIYFCSHEGVTTVISADPEYQVLSNNQLDGDIMASPIAVEDSLIIRSDKAIYRIRE